MPEVLIGVLVLLVAGFGYALMMRIGGALDQKRVIAEMEADLLRIEAEFCNKCASAGALAFKNAVPRTSNPYIFANTNKPSGKFADYWNRGYAAAAKKAANDATFRDNGSVAAQSSCCRDVFKTE